MRDAHLFAVLVSCVSVVGGCADRDASAGALLDVDVSAAAQTQQAIHNVCPDGETTYGIDVSVYQGDIDWPRVAGAGVRFAIVRVGDGLGHDSKFQRNWDGAKAAGITRGVYQFFRSDDDPIAQADILIDAVGHLEPGDLPPVADVESTDGVSNATRAARLQQWLDHVEAALGVVPLIYTGGYFWQDNVARDFSRYPLWHAGYTGGTCPSTVADQWPAWTFWQFSSTGRVAGISGDVDENRFNGSLDDLHRFARRNRPPRGSVDVVSCAPVAEGGGIAGWAVDDDVEGVGDGAIDVEVAIDGRVVAVARADVYRDDLCNAVGSCNHGYVVAVQNAFKDGVDHSVVVTGVDDQGENAALVATASTFRCDPPALPPGALRAVASPEVMSAWGFSFDDVADYRDDDLADRVAGAPWPAAPRVVRADGDAAVYVVDDDGLKRQVIDPASLAAWAFDEVAVVGADVIDAMATGADWPAAPFLLRGDGATVYVLDVLDVVARDDDGGDEGEGEGDVDGGRAVDDVRVITVHAASCAAGGSDVGVVGAVVLLLVRRRRPA